MENPFLTTGYKNPALFCDREKELAELMQSVPGPSRVTLIAHRRMGKTGLIMRFFDELKQQSVDVTTLYVDIFATRSLDDFIKALSETVLATYPETTSFGHRFMNFIKTLRPVMSFDPITGTPEISINYQTESEKTQTLRGILEFLEKQDKPVILAIDEFQQIREYPGQTMEAQLRTIIQHLHNVSFIFCGSKKHMMVDIFSNPGNPFYASTAFMFLDPIAEESYKEFIARKFAEAGRTITPEAVEFILKWTRRHTYYTQSLAHAVFNLGHKETDVGEVREACASILKANEGLYFQYREMLTSAQWNFLIAVACENEVTQITAAEFLVKYKIGSASTSRRILRSLLDKELLVENTGLRSTSYTLYDVFLLRWLETTYR